MRRIVKRLASALLVPLTKWYLRKERMYSDAGITVHVYPGVFHPGLFSSTKLLVECLDGVNLESKTLLELGSGTGFLSIAAARRGAKVTASDLSATAVENTKRNAERNNVTVEVVHSDLFAGMPGASFDVIVINPPYYARNPGNESEVAWHCGEGFEYFHKLFSQLGEHINANSAVLMVLTLGCDLERIFSIGKANGFEFQLVKEKNVFFDGKDYVYKIVHANEPHRT